MSLFAEYRLGAAIWTSALYLSTATHRDKNVENTLTVDIKYIPIEQLFCW